MPSIQYKGEIHSKSTKDVPLIVAYHSSNKEEVQFRSEVQYVHF